MSKELEKNIMVFIIKVLLIGGENNE